MRKILLATAAVALFAGPALAQSNITVVTPPERNTVVVSPPQQAAEPSSPAYESKTVEHSNNGYSDKTKKSEEHLNPDGSSSSSTKTIKHDDE